MLLIRLLLQDVKLNMGSFSFLSNAMLMKLTIMGRWVVKLNSIGLDPFDSIVKESSC